MLRGKTTKLKKYSMPKTIANNNHNTDNIESKKIREKLHQLVNTTRTRIFKNDPISWIRKQQVSFYKRELAWQLYELTHLLNMECWGIIVDMLFKEHSQVIFSLIHQLSSSTTNTTTATYDRSLLPYLTGTDESLAATQKIANSFNTNIVLYKPNYIPQYLRVDTHYINIITSSSSGLSQETMLMYSQPIEYLYSLDFHFQLGSLTDLRFEETVRTFFDLNKCLIDIQDFDHELVSTITTATTSMTAAAQIEQEQNNSIKTFKQRFDWEITTRGEARYKTFVALWCQAEDSKVILDHWWLYLDNRSLTIEEFVILLIKVSTSYSGTIILIYKENYSCLCGDSYQTDDLMVCEVHDDGVLSIPNEFSKRDLDTKYKRQPLISLVNDNKSLFVN